MEMKTAKTGSNYSYWEVFRYGHDKDIFEIVSSPVPRFIGTRVQLKGPLLVMKEIGTYHSDDSSTLVTPYGGITAAVFKRVEEYTKITVYEALEALSNDRQVHVKKGDEFLTTYLYGELDNCGIEDFHDLLTTDFYIKK